MPAHFWDAVRPISELAPRHLSELAPRHSVPKWRMISEGFRTIPDYPHTIKHENSSSGESMIKIILVLSLVFTVSTSFAGAIFQTQNYDGVQVYGGATEDVIMTSFNKNGVNVPVMITLKNNHKNQRAIDVISKVGDENEKIGTGKCVMAKKAIVYTYTLASEMSEDGRSSKVVTQTIKQIENGGIIISGSSTRTWSNYAKLKKTQ